MVEPESADRGLEAPPSPKLPLVVVMAVVLVAAAAAYWMVRDHRATQVEAVHRRLKVISGLKLAGLEAWRLERSHDIGGVAMLPGLAERLIAAGRAPGGGRADLAEFDLYARVLIQTHACRRVVLLGPDFGAAYTMPEDVVWTCRLDEATKRRIETAREPLFEEVSCAADAKSMLSIMAPVRTAGGECAGAVVLQIEAEDALYPLVHGWPEASETGEGLLVRRAGGEVVYFSPQRRREGQSLEFRLPLATSTAIAARALREGLTGVIEGMDYDGVPVVAIVEPVPDTPWTLISKIGREEAYASVQSRARMIVLGLGLLAIAAMAAGWAWWQHRLERHARLRLELERMRRTSAERLALVMRHAGDAILLFDERMRIVEANEKVREVYGWTPEEMRQFAVSDLRAAETRPTAEADFAVAFTEQGLRFETDHVRKDGTVFPVEVSARAVAVEGRRHVLSVVRDISERRRLEGELALQREQFRVVFECAPVGLSLSSGESGRSMLVNPAHARITGVPVECSNEPGVFARASHPGDYVRQMEMAQKFRTGEIDHYTFEKRYLHADGSVQWAELTSRLLIDPVTGEKRAVTTLTDINERKAHLREMENLNRLYQVIRRVNQALVRAEAQDALMTEVCEILVGQGQLGGLARRGPGADCPGRARRRGDGPAADGGHLLRSRAGGGPGADRHGLPGRQGAGLSGLDGQSDGGAVAPGPAGPGLSLGHRPAAVLRGPQSRDPERVFRGDGLLRRGGGAVAAGDRRRRVVCARDVCPR